MPLRGSSVSLPVVQDAQHWQRQPCSSAALVHVSGCCSDHRAGKDDVCPNGHQIQLHLAPEEGWTCDVCRKAVGIGSLLTGCRICNWDRCGQCSKQARLGTAFLAASNRPKCPNGHCMTYVLGEHLHQGGQVWICNGCERRCDLHDGAALLRCDACDFDLCLTCGQGQATGRHAGRNCLQCACGHNLLVSLADSQPWACNYCGRSEPWEAGSLRFSCPPCRYNCCETCRSKLERQVIC